MLRVVQRGALVSHSRVACLQVAEARASATVAPTRAQQGVRSNFLSR